MSQTPSTPSPAAISTVRSAEIVPLDEAVAAHVSPVYWDWCSLFGRDTSAHPFQHPDYVLAELDAVQSKSRLRAVAVRGTTPMTEQGKAGLALGILVPKLISTGSVGGIGPGWTLHGLRLAGGRFLGDESSFDTQLTLLTTAMRHCEQVKADFLLIEDLDVRMTLYGVVANEALSGRHMFAAKDFQPRLRIVFPPTEAEYWAMFSSRTLSKFRRSLKKFGTTQLIRVTELEQIPDFLRAAHEISKQSWQSRQFGLRIKNNEFELRQMSALAQQGLLRSYLWLIDGKPSAFAICNQSGGTFCYEEVAFCGEHAQHSPGKLMLQQICVDLYQHNTPKILDFGGGDAEYKRQFANRESHSGTVWLVPRSWKSALTLRYLKTCRALRSTGRAMIGVFGIARYARQWIRRRTPLNEPNGSDESLAEQGENNSSGKSESANKE